MINLKVLSTAAILALTLPVVLPSAALPKRCQASRSRVVAAAVAGNL